MDTATWISNHPVEATFAGTAIFLVLLFVYDVFQRRHAIVHNFPLVGHLRYLLESIGPELRQYWVANDKEETPFNRAERSWIYASSKGQNSNTGFGTTELLYDIGYPIIKHATFPYPDADYPGVDGDKTAIPCLKTLGGTHNRLEKFRPRSIVNISAMSFGSLSARAVASLNLGAKEVGCLHNTGEGGISPYHLKGADVLWQIGTGYFGCRNEDGRFSMELFKKAIEDHPQIRAIEVKLSQGAKPGKGGILPGSKVTAEIAAIRKVPKGKTVHSPNAHQEFSNVNELIEFVERLAEASGKPVGIKSAVGEIRFWENLARTMANSGQGPDFITIDGAEGGTGAAPLHFADHVALPFKVGFARVYQLFLKEKIAHEVVWIGSGKLGFPDRALIALAMGCDMINIAREPMMAIGCIQAQKCHTGHCPAGVATQSWWLQAGIDVNLKAKRLAEYIRAFRKELLLMSHAAGYEHPSQMQLSDIEVSVGVNKFVTLREIFNYQKANVQVAEQALFSLNPNAL